MPLNGEAGSESASDFPAYRFAHAGYEADSVARDATCGRLRSLVIHAHALVILQISPDAFISNVLSLEPGEDLHDFVYFADRPSAFGVYAGRLSRPLRAHSASIDRTA